MKIVINEEIAIDTSDIQVGFVPASGPGGQNVNKVASKAQLRFDVRSPALPEDVRSRLFEIAGNRINNEGFLLIEGQRFRSQERNRADVIDRLVELLHQAAAAPVERRKTRPTLKSRRQRLESKRRRSQTKRLRRRVDSFQE